MSCRGLVASTVVVVALGWLPVSHVTAQAPMVTPPAGPPAAPAKDAAKPEAAKPDAPKPVVQKLFGSAEEAVEALLTALRAHNTATLISILGAGSRPLIVSGDPVADRRARERFVEAYDEAHALAVNGVATKLRIGKDDWPFPIPVVKDGERWRFDSRQGRDEILARRIGRNELYTIQTCLAYVDAQREYWAEDRMRGGVLQYARKFASTPGKRDGLYWPTKPGEPDSPLGQFVARARSEGYQRDKTGGLTPYQGYLFRILTRQGPDAPDGAYDYLIRGMMIAGFGLVAYPAQYGASGVMTFIVNHDGVVYEKDLGPTTVADAAAMRGFNPDSTWTKADVPN